MSVHYIDIKKRSSMLPFDKIIAKYKKLGCPEDVFNPCNIPLKRNKYFVLLSERSVGKTTNVILFGMCAHEICGTQIQYIRQHSDMITPKTSRQLFDTILRYDYVSKITGGRWSSVTYWAAGWYYCNTDDNGKVTERAEKPFMYCLGLNKAEDYKSVYNAPTGDIIIFDEFISRYYAQDEFILFCDVVKTIIRDRQEPIIFMLGNTLDRYNHYFSELEILNITTSIPIGEHTETVTTKGTPIYVEIVTREKTPERLTFNKLFFGFKNKKLGSITGEDWAITPVQHIDDKDADNRTVIYNYIYIIVEGQLIQLELVRSDKYGTHVLAHMARKTYEDSRIYSVDLMHDSRYRYRFGFDNLDKLIWTLYNRKKFYYANNLVGVLVDKYVTYATKAKSLY